MSFDSVKRAAARLLPNPKRLFKANVPELEDYVGRTVLIDGKKIMIRSVRGNVGMTLRENAKPCFYEINGKYLINMLRFHAQMTGDTSITEEQFKEFENIEYEIEKMEVPSLKEGPNGSKTANKA